MKVCHIISGDLWAGAEVMDFHLMKGLSRIPGVELHAIVLNAGKLARELERERIAVRVIEENRCGFVALLRQVREAISRTDPDIIHSHRVKENILAFLSVIGGRPVPLVCTQHGMPEPSAGGLKAIKKTLVGKIHQAVLSNHFRRIVSVSDELREKLVRDFGCEKRK
jgi:glycosyltransferase involved in cell wall biosynthesis